MEIINLLKSTKNHTVKYFQLSTDKFPLTYPKGKWNIRKILIHLADAESVFNDRIKRVISEHRQVIWGFDQDAWCEYLNYQDFPLEISQSLYLANRNSIIYLTEKYYQTHKDKEFIHSETGLRTLRDEIDKVVFHNQHHLQQIKTALEHK